MVRGQFTSSTTCSTRPWRQPPTQVANSARRFVTNWMRRDVFPAAKFPDLMAACVSRAVTSMTMPAAFWKRPKAPKTARFCTRSFTVTMRLASKPVILCLTHPANWWVAATLQRFDRLLLRKLERKVPDKRTILENRQMLTVALSDQSHRHLVVRLPQPVKKTTKPA